MIENRHVSGSATIKQPESFFGRVQDEMRLESGYVRDRLARASLIPKLLPSKKIVLSFDLGLHHHRVAFQ
jgi:hypothetical protein